MSELDRRARAAARRERMVLTRSRLGELGPDPCPTSGADAITLVTRLSRASWALSGREQPSYSRHETPYRFVAGRPR